MKVRDDYSNMCYTAKRALIVYQNDRGKVLCTLNEIKEGKILSGVPVDCKKLSGLFELTGREPKKSAGSWQWQDPRILARSESAVLWYAAPRRQEIFFSCRTRALMSCSGKMFPWPGLVFMARQNTLTVFAVKTSRPNRDSKLYTAPFWNITNGSVCLPADRKDPQTIDEWEKVFYGSAFSHPGATPVISRTAFSKLVPALIRSGAKKFPAEELVDAGITIADLMNDRRR